MRVGASLQRRITSNGPGRGILEPPDRESWSSLGPAKVGTAECLRFQDGDATWRSPWAAVPPLGSGLGLGFGWGAITVCQSMAVGAIYMCSLLFVEGTT